jgi:hypothetical protein
MSEFIEKQKTKEIMDLSWDIKQVRFNYKDLLLTWLLWINLDDPGKLVVELTAYRKIH